MLLRVFAGLLLAVSLLALHAPAASAQASDAQAQTDIQQAEIAAAEANRARIARRPSFVSGPEPDYPESERALGHHGEVVVRGLLGTDGRLRYTTIATSSRAPALDQAALEAVSQWVFQPAADAEGEAIPVMTAVPTGFYSYTSAVGVGAALYTCRQFVLDMDWWIATFSDKPLSDHRFYTMVLGLGVVSRLHLGAERAFAAESTQDFQRRWMATIEACRARPEARFAEMIHPEGDIIDGMAAQQPRRRRR